MNFDFKHIHFVGIGGISMSGLARMAMDKGVQVSGSDRDDLLGSELNKSLVANGAIISSGGHSTDNIVEDIDLLVYSAAIPQDNPELIRARELNIKILKRSEFLGLISQDYYTIAVSGTHGKTTTSAMITKILKDAGLDPSALVGSVMSEYGSNFIKGNSKYLVVEACEYERQFLALSPKIVVVTNIEADHLDYYKDLNDIYNAFVELVGKIPNDGVLICRSSEKELFTAVEALNIVDYLKENAEGLKLKIPGKHNIANAQAALAVCEVLGIEHHVAIKALNDFRGTARRFEFKGKTHQGAEVYDDYAHHPTEIKATLSGVREMFPNSRIIVVFQPHLYSRTADFMDEFAESFCDASEVLLADIYPAREEIDQKMPGGKTVPHVHSRDLVEAIQKKKYSGSRTSCIENVRYLGGFDEIVDYIKKESRPGDIIITMGAGDVGTMELCG